MSLNMDTKKYAELKLNLGMVFMWIYFDQSIDIQEVVNDQGFVMHYRTISITEI